jgi:hypothetical protein
MSTVNKSGQVGKDAQLCEGLATVFGKGAKMQVQGKEVKVKDVMDLLNKRGANAQAAEEARSAFHRAIAADREYRAETHALISAVRAALVANLSPDDFAKCGLATRKTRRVPSSEEQNARVVKARSTRAAKGARGKRQVRKEKAKAALAAAYAPNGSGPAPNAPPPTPPALGGNGAQ